jgi:hypothetical protein
MAIAHYLVNVEWIRDNSIPADNVVNTLHFIGESGTTTRLEDAAVIAEAIDDALQPIETYMSSVLNGQRVLTFYDLNDPQPRAPLTTISQGYIVNTGSQALPSEVALVLSFQATRVSGDPQARRRGRIYIGPLNQSAVATDSAGDARPASAFITAMTQVGSLLANDVALADLPWAVFSPTALAAGEGDLAWASVVDGWVDNAFDTQRRRGASATARTTWT